VNEYATKTLHSQESQGNALHKAVSVAMKAFKSGLWAFILLSSVSSFSPSPALPHRGIIRSTVKLGSLSNSRRQNDTTNDTTRSEFISECLRRSLSALTLIGILPKANAFDGGVGGLGKKKPETGVVFRDPDAASSTSSLTSDDVTNELLAPDGTPAFVTFSSPWPQLQSAAGIEARDVSGGYESAFVQVAELPKGVSTINSVKPEFLSQVIFSSTGKFGEIFSWIHYNYFLPCEMLYDYSS